MQEFIIQTMNQFGYLGICFLIIIENVFPPIPSEVILFFGGFMTTYSNMTVPGVVLFSTLGSTFGAMILYQAGCLLTPARLEQLLDTRLFHALGFEKGDVSKTLGWFDRRGKKAILFGRCVPIIRSLISIPAGMAGIKLPLFLSYTVIGSTIWNIFLVSLGAFMGSSWEIIRQYLKSYSAVTRIILLGSCIILVITWVKKRKSQ